MYLKILQNFCCLVVFENRANTLIGHEENFVNFKFLEGQFWKEKPSFVH